MGQSESLNPFYTGCMSTTSVYCSLNPLKVMHVPLMHLVYIQNVDYMQHLQNVRLVTYKMELKSCFWDWREGTPMFLQHNSITSIWNSYDIVHKWVLNIGVATGVRTVTVHHITSGSEVYIHCTKLTVPLNSFIISRKLAHGFRNFWHNLSLLDVYLNAFFEGLLASLLDIMWK